MMWKTAVKLIWQQAKLSFPSSSPASSLSSVHKLCRGASLYKWPQGLLLYASVLRPIFVIVLFRIRVSAGSWPVHTPIWYLKNNVNSQTKTIRIWATNENWAQRLAVLVIKLLWPNRTNSLKCSHTGPRPSIHTYPYMHSVREHDCTVMCVLCNFERGEACNHSRLSRVDALMSSKGDI